MIPKKKWSWHLPSHREPSWKMLVVVCETITETCSVCIDWCDVKYDYHHLDSRHKYHRLTYTQHWAKLAVCLRIDGLAIGGEKEFGLIHVRIATMDGFFEPRLLSKWKKGCQCLLMLHLRQIIAIYNLKRSSDWRHERVNQSKSSRSKFKSGPISSCHDVTESVKNELQRFLLNLIENMRTFFTEYTVNESIEIQHKSHDISVAEKLSDTLAASPVGWWLRIARLNTGNGKYEFVKETRARIRSESERKWSFVHRVEHTHCRTRSDAVLATMAMEWCKIMEIHHVPRHAVETVCRMQTENGCTPVRKSADNSILDESKSGKTCCQWASLERHSSFTYRLFQSLCPSWEAYKISTGLPANIWKLIGWVMLNFSLANPG
jgi:hypothetical protein